MGTAEGPIRAQIPGRSRSTWYISPIFGLASGPERQSGGHLMRHRAVGLWGGFLVLGATALLGAVLLVSGPATAATCPYGPCTQPTTVTPTTAAGSTTPPVVTQSSTPTPTPSATP